MASQPQSTSAFRPAANQPMVSPGRVWCARSGPNNGVATVWLSNPGRLNALSVNMWRDMTDCFRRFSADHQLRVVIVRGEGGAFASGADISEFPEVRATREQAEHYHDRIIGDALRAIMHCPVPVLAAIDGPCIGAGLEIAAVADLRVCSDRSTFGVPIGKLGFPLAPHEAACVVSLIGRANTLEILLEGRIWSSQEALSKGLVGRRVANDEWETEIQATAARVASGAPHAARRNKWLIQLLSRLDDQALLSPGQREACWDFIDTRDYARGLDAFMTKSRPQFNHD